MGRTTPRQMVVKKKPPTEAAKFGDFQNPDMSLKGYWLYEDRPISVEIPILPHGFYPKLGHTDYEIRQNITYRRVTVPSISELRQHGIEVFKAFFVVEVVVHPRHIKNWNYFRGDFPAAVKSIAHNHNVLIILPANDMPSGRLERKDVLNLWRQLFTPLFIKGHHYTSGRMSMFMAAPPNSLNKMKAALNLEHKSQEDNLLEWYPSVGRTHTPRLRGPRSKFNRYQLKYAELIADATTERMHDQVLPLVAEKLGIQPNTPAGKDLEKYLTSPETSRELIKVTSRGNPSKAVHEWVKYRMVPKLKEIVKEEGTQAVEQATRQLLNFAFEATISAILGNILRQTKKTNIGEKLTRPISWQPQIHISPSFGLGRMAYTPKDLVSSGNLLRNTQQMYTDMKLNYKENFMDDTTVPFDEFIDIIVGKDASVKLVVNKSAFNTIKSQLPERLGKLGDEPLAYENFVHSFLPALEKKYSAYLKAGTDLVSSMTGYYGDMGF